MIFILLESIRLNFLYDFDTFQLSHKAIHFFDINHLFRLIIFRLKIQFICYFSTNLKISIFFVLITFLPDFYLMKKIFLVDFLFI
jgi:hypothetical protein